MDAFEEALAVVEAALREIAEGPGPQPTASRTALERLKAAASEQGTAAGPSMPVEKTRGKIAAGTGDTAQNSPSTPSLKVWTWETLHEAVMGCVKCAHLVASRKNVVFGVGNRQAELMFVGEAPGADEDEQGEPFVGRAGQLLTKIIQAMGIERRDVFIANVLKCRPDIPPGMPGNRKPRPEEMATCLPWLVAQIELVNPKVIVALGATAAEGLLGEKRPMKQIRGRWFDYKGRPVMVTYHPSYLLHNNAPSEKRKVWEDMLEVMERLGWPISQKQRGYFLSKTGASSGEG